MLAIWVAAFALALLGGYSNGFAGGLEPVARCHHSLSSTQAGFNQVDARPARWRAGVECTYSADAPGGKTLSITRFAPAQTIDWWFLAGMAVFSATICLWIVAGLHRIVNLVRSRRKLGTAPG